MDQAGPTADDHGPVVVLAYAYSGVAQIERLLGASTALACTSGTGLLPLCAEAADCWRCVDGRAGPLSPLAASSVRALVSTMITTVVARVGGARWCEISFSPPAAAETFLELYPRAKFICWHRNGLDVIRVGVQANPWGLAGTGLGPFVTAYPGSSPAAMAAYWAECTEALLRFQQAHPAACRQVRYEDLTRQPGHEAGKISAFLGLEAATTSLAGPAADGQAWEPDPAGPEGRDADQADGRLPDSHLPAPLMDRVNDLQARLGYPPVARSRAGRAPPWPGDGQAPADSYV